jgi:hypothetical protein
MRPCSTLPKADPAYAHCNARTRHVVIVKMARRADELFSSVISTETVWTS